MGSDTFFMVRSGKSARDAFKTACEDALYEHGHGGYTGTIAEKDSFQMIDCPKDVKPKDYAEKLIDEGDPRVDDKWGPAGCIALGDNKYLFFGLASS